MEIREIKTLPELEKVQKLEEEVWEASPIPIHQTLTAVKNGGIVVGAFDGEELVGFSYGFAGFKNGKPHLTSHMLGIKKGMRAKGIGEALKQEQRKIAINLGYDMMLWTYDPLETRNGYLNLTKLHAICDTYVENCYGEMQDGLNKGLPSDRFEVNWYLTSKYVEQEQQFDSTNAVTIVNYQLNGNGLPILGDFEPNQLLNEDVYLLPVSPNFQELKSLNPKLALDWRFKTRLIIQTLFKQGFAAIRIDKGEKMHNYVFVKKEKLSL